ncbi:prepilin-type N-terminal cleavage/methylation domain-containing protein, partial [bacterium]|nr:prepilin-type N-terminal cleavage/methylation domain-containing protein [bacterium]
MKRLSGFSLMEMMIVLLIVSIVAAASAPMINRRMVSEAANGCEWEWNNDLSALYFDRLNNAVAIGTSESGRVPPDPNTTPRLHIASEGNPHIRLTDETQTPNVAANISFLNNNISFTAGTIEPGTTGGVAIGPDASLRRGEDKLPNDAIAIGNVTAKQASGIAIGNNVQMEAGKVSSKVSVNTIAIGTSLNAYKYADNSIIMGIDSSSNAINNIAIGQGVTNNADRTILFGRGASANIAGDNSIGIGSPSIKAENVIAVTTSTTDITGSSSVVIGGGFTSIGTAAVSMGANGNASGETSVAIGFRAHATA